MNLNLTGVFGDKADKPITKKQWAELKKKEFNLSEKIIPVASRLYCAKEILLVGDVKEAIRLLKEKLMRYGMQYSWILMEINKIFGDKLIPKEAQANE